jgi:hypothetical protein
MKPSLKENLKVFGSTGHQAIWLCRNCIAKLPLNGAAYSAYCEEMLNQEY